MKKLITILTLLLISQVLHAQAPQATSYQAVIRNSSGNVIANQLVKLRFSIHDSAVNGTVVYQETQNSTTNAQGLINLFVGQGTAVTGTFAGINWGNKSKFLQTEIDITGGINYTDMGTTQLMSVPYTLYANNGMPSGTTIGEILYWNGSSWVKLNPGTNGQNLTFCNGVPQWGPCLSLPIVLTGSITNKTDIAATAGGNVIDSGSARITERGVCFSTTINPTIANTKTASGTNIIGAFTVSLTGLSALTTYHYRAYATTSLGTSYGADSVFTTTGATVTTLTTTAASSITTTTATSGGNITSDGGATITARGICWSTTINPTIALTTKTLNGTGTGAFTSSITGLTANTTYYVRAYATNSAGTAYGTQQTFTTLTNIPTVTTNTISSITTTTATSGGNITSDGGVTITARGICWSTTANPTIALATKTVDGTGTGAFTSSITGLTANTTYYVRAYATNSAGTAYGTQQTFITLTNIPTVNTNAISSISTSTATSGGNITSDGGATITARGICWSTTANPTIALTTKTVDGTGAGSFTSSITGLTANTTYYVRAYATNSIGTSYGADSVFTTTGALVATLTTTAASTITATTATSGGNITSDGGATITARGVCWSTTVNPTIALTTKTVNGTGTGAFTSSITGLTANTTYYVRAYATNSAGTTYGTQQTFTTLTNIPTVTTNTISSITTTTATSGGNITSDGGATITARGICWSTTASPTTALATKTVNGTGTGSFTSSITGLTANTTYYVRAYATNSVGTAYGADSLFTTSGANVATLTTTAASTITATTATSGGNITSDGGATITVRGICWSTTANPTIALTTKTVDGTGTGVFTSSITGLTANTIYYVRAYATNSAGTAYGTQQTFTTLTNLPTVTTNTISGITTTTATSGGNITSDGGVSITARGICWSTTANPTIALATKTVDGTGTGAFTSSITSLTANTTYFVRAYATNSVGTSYGADSVFTTTGALVATLTTTAASTITGTTATSGGNITSDGGATITARGICWSTTANPTISLTTKTVDGTGTGAFTSSITGLTANTIYYVRAYATNSAGTAYGAQQTLTTLPTLIPTVTTNAISSITSTTATSGGNITSDGGATITARGICWSTTANPTIALTTKTVDGTGAGSFTSSITGLTANTTYYVRAYATNSVGTAYGAQQTFTTANAVANLSSVAIGSQVWTTQNLSVPRYRNGDIIPQVTDASQWAALTTGAWCWYNNDSATYAATYGRLYNWYAVNDARGLAPQGWHVPSDGEWNNLVKYLDAGADTTCVNCAQSSIAGGAMKSVTGWNSNSGATNSIGFAGLPGGYYNTNGSFYDIGTDGDWWSSTEDNLTNAWYRNLNQYSNTVIRNYYTKGSGFSVRCVRDTTPILTTTNTSNITTITATSGGNITIDGGTAITARGICWSTTANPTVSLITKTNNGTGAGSFTSSISGLTANTTYYVRAYATNSLGTSYGNQQIFTTLNTNTTTLPNVTIGSQVWTTQNLSVPRYRNGDIIPQVTNASQWENLTTGAWCWYNNDSATYAATFGRLYNWYAVNDSRGLAPQGWHVPSNAEWGRLVKYLDAGADTASCSGCYQSYIAGGAMKSTTGWAAPNTGATNSSGFTGLPGGYRQGGTFNNVYLEGSWWSTTDDDNSGNTWNYYLNYTVSGVNRVFQDKRLGFSVRCVMNTTPILTTTTASSITTTTAASGGNITIDGGTAITARGICWSTTANPTIALATKTVNGTGAGSFTSNITGLVTNTTYYVRAYATNSLGTNYGTQQTFTTLIIAIPTVTTNAIGSITSTTATSGGNITSDGGATITARGVCWSTTANPTVSLTTKTNNGTGSGVFTSSITGLTANTTYYVRAYATNSVGTSYGNQQIFTTSNTNTTTLPNVTIGSQLWTTQNLSVPSYRNGDIIPQVTDDAQWNSLTTGAWCWYNNDSATYAATYGRLYNWYAVNDARGLAPQGWHVPSNVEWDRMVKYLDADADTTCYGCYSSLIAGGAMKNTTGWNAPNSVATNSSGFGGLPGGYRPEGGGFGSIGVEGSWWSSTEDNTATPWYRNLNYSVNYVLRYVLDKHSGLSVRCVRDTTPILTTNTVSSITTTTATSGGNITINGGTAITARGVCWSTTANPTIALSTKTVNGTGGGSFTSSITGLSLNTTYYVRAYATNSVGTSYGNQQIFTTSNTNTTTLPNVTIGSQVWTTQNLSVPRYRNNDIIPQVTDDAQWASLTTGAWCWYNNDSATYAATYGRLYNWYAVNDVRGLAPQGWHVPSNAEWGRLAKYLDAEADTASCYGCIQSNIAGGAMKSTTGWAAPNTGATNSSGFSGLPSSARYDYGAFGSIDQDGNWWSSSEDDNASPWYYNLSYFYSWLIRANRTKGSGFSVRCVMNATPILTTTTASSITTTTATFGGNITIDGGATVTARGICWSATANPTIALTTKTVNGTGAGSFTSSITGLLANTTYYVRAYATNSLGTSYGNQQIFTTSNTTTTTLPNVTIGSQVWTTQNLSVPSYRNGDIIPQVTVASQWNSLTTGAWCWYNNDSATYAATYGRLYNWYAVNDARGLAPQGYHIPSDAEWNKLVKYLDAGADTTCISCTQSTIAGGAMKSTTGWTAPNTGATNSSGFAGLPGSFRDEVGVLFGSIGNDGYWWSSSSTENGPTYRKLIYSDSGVNKNYGPALFGYSVRCVRD